MSEKLIILTNSSQRLLAVNPRHIAMVMPVNIPDEQNKAGINSTIIFAGLPVSNPTPQPENRAVRPEMVHVVESLQEIREMVEGSRA